MEVKLLKNYINGRWVESKTSKWLEVRNPATDEVIALCPETTKEEIDQTVGVLTAVVNRLRSMSPFYADAEKKKLTSR